MRTAILAAALALPLAAAAQTAPEFQPNGEVLFRISGGSGTSAAYDESHVIGPSVNLEESDGGAWVGDIGGEGVSLEVSDTKVHGVGVDLNVKREKDKLVVRGNVMNQRVWLEIAERKLSGRVGDCSLDLSLKAPGTYTGNIGCSRGTQTPRTGRAEVRFDGSAREKDPPHPQFTLAVVTALL